MKTKTILAAGIVRDIEFSSHFVADGYLNALRFKYFDFKILDRCDRSDGTVIVRILTPYNSSDLIEL